MKPLLFALLAMTLLTRSAFAAPTESPVTLKVPGGTLYGTLLVPEGKGRFPVALIIAGSGPTDREGNSGKLAFTDDYKLLARSLASSGIATLRYDKRGIGESFFPRLKESDLRFEDYVDDAALWAQRLKSDARFSRVSIIGHSEGSLIGMLVAQKVPGLGSLVSLEGMGFRLGDTLRTQLRANPANAPILDEALSTLGALENGKTVDRVSPVLMPLFHPSIQPYLMSELKYDPAAEIAKLKLPVLIVQGTHDIQVSTNDSKRLSAALPAAQVSVIDGMNHILRDTPSEMMANYATYSQPSLPLSAKLVPAISAFLLASK
ncbi:MAG: alpha/beta hydrolase [Candidatus Baltobacteraceae bacterium]